MRGWFEKSWLTSVLRTRPFIRGAALTVKVAGFLVKEFL
jgi:hypothetical protein